MIRRMLPLLCLVLPIVVGCEAKTRERTRGSNGPEALVNQPAPGIVGKDLDGKSMKLAYYRGKVVVLTFWADF